MQFIANGQSDIDEIYIHTVEEKSHVPKPLLSDIFQTRFPGESFHKWGMETSVGARWLFFPGMGGELHAALNTLSLFTAGTDVAEMMLQTTLLTPFLLLFFRVLHIILLTILLEELQVVFL